MTNYIEKAKRELPNYPSQTLLVRHAATLQRADANQKLIDTINYWMNKIDNQNSN